MNKLLVVVDMQNDFVTGSLGSDQAVTIVDLVVTKVKQEKKNGTTIVFTKDTHESNYLQTQEGSHLPVKHCVKGSEGWKLIPQLTDISEGCTVVEKPAFGSMALAHMVEEQKFDEIELIGLCTDICVISNALIIKASAPEIPVSVISSCCAGVTPRTHENAIEAMKMCQIDILP